MAFEALAFDVYVVTALVLLLAGVALSVFPGFPGALASAAGLTFYWLFGTGADVGETLLLVLIAVTVVAAVFDIVGGMVAAKTGGASAKLSFFAFVIGVAAAFVLTPLAFFVVFPLVIYVAMVRVGPRRDAARAAAITLVGMLASKIIQFSVTVTVLVVFAVFLL